MPPIAGVGNYEQAPLPVSAHIRGIKGEARIRFDGSAAGVGKWYGSDGVALDPQPTAFQTYAALAGIPQFTFAKNVWDYDEYYDFAAAIHIPVFVALYRGTYKAIDDTAGWEIDSGPGDDPDVLLAMDISNPTALESSRLDWWDVDWVPAPRLPNLTPVTADGLSWASESPHKGSFHRYALSLEANKRLGADQVLWLHFQTGTIRLPVMYGPAAGASGAILTCAYYQAHKFSFSVHASMLVDTKVKL